MEDLHVVGKCNVYLLASFHAVADANVLSQLDLIVQGIQALEVDATEQKLLIVVLVRYLDVPHELLGFVAVRFFLSLFWPLQYSLSQLIVE